MKQIPILEISFEGLLNSGYLPKFRGAIINLLENKENENLFHQHDGQKLIYRYPLIQYKVIRHQPEIFGFGEGAFQLTKIFKDESATLDIGGQSFSLKVNKLSPKSHLFNIWETQFTYRLQRWLPFNSQLWQEYESLTGLSERINMLERILTANIINMAKGIEWQVEKRISIKITQVLSEYSLTYKNVKFKAFDIKFDGNVSLPFGIGLGKSCSHGFGIVMPINRKKGDE